MLAIPQRTVSVPVSKPARDAARRQLDKQRQSCKLRNDADALVVVSAAARDGDWGLRTAHSVCVLQLEADTMAMAVELILCRGFLHWKLQVLAVCCDSI